MSLWQQFRMQRYEHASGLRYRSVSYIVFFSSDFFLSFMSVTGSRILDIRFYWHIISFLNTETGQDFKSKRNHCSQPRRRSHWKFNKCACAGFHISRRVVIIHSESITRSQPLTTRYSKWLMFSVYVVV
jgi:hypothetical protein